MLEVQYSRTGGDMRSHLADTQAYFLTVLLWCTNCRPQNLRDGLNGGSLTQDLRGALFRRQRITRLAVNPV